MRIAILCVSAAFVLAGCGSEKSVSSPAASAPAKNPGIAALHTLPDLHPPRLNVDHPARGAAEGLVFVAEKGGKHKPSGTVIADSTGRIVWYHEVPFGLEATDFRTQTYQGKPVLTWWQGTISKTGVGRGSYVVYDASYHELATVKAGGGLEGDLHEFELTPRGTAYITSYDEVPRDLTAVGGPKKGFAYDSVVQEIDVDSGKVVFEWHSLDHVPLSESLQANREPAQHASEKRPLDYFHVNSAADGPGGTVLISARNTSALYLLRRDGSIAWRLGGKRSDFGPRKAVTFYYQHNARFHPDGTLSLFDNGGIPRAEKVSRPIVLKLDQTTKRAQVLKTYPTAIASPYEGNLQLLPDGGAFVGWGGVRKVTEYGADMKVRFQMTLPYGDTYRGYRLPWAGDPGGKPLVAVAGDRVFASWNGKAGIARWQVLAGPDPDHLAPVASRPWGGLETRIALEVAPKAVAVRALAPDGAVLGQSETLEP